MLQGVGNGNVLGWVADRAHPLERIGVAVVVDGEIAAEGIADVPRPDLATLELGDGAHGFMVALPERLQTPARHRILLLAGPEQVPIPAAPSFWHKPSLDGTWSDVVFEPGGMLSARVPDPPIAERRALVAKGWLCDANEVLAHGHVTEERLAQIAGALVGVADACAALGIGYVPALVPRKRDVLAGAPAGEREWVGELSTRLRDVDDVELIDLLPVLRDAARHGPAYNRTDADWNERGAFFAARALLKEAHKHVRELRPPGLSDLRLRGVPGYRGTLMDVPKVQISSGKLVPRELTEEVQAEHGIAIDPSQLQALRMPVEQHLAEAGSVHLRVYAAPHDDRARLALIGDAAALALLPWVAERASRTTFFWTSDLPLDQLELELPPVVLHLLRESDLQGGPLPKVLRAAPSPADTVAASGQSPQNGTHRDASAALANGAGRLPPAAASFNGTGRLPAAAASSNGAVRLPPAAASSTPGITSSPAGAPPPTGASSPGSTPLARTTLAAPNGMRALPAGALRAGAAMARQQSVHVLAALRTHAWTIALVGLLTILSWPFTNILGAPGLDSSWEVGLQMAVAHGLVFGQQVVFTYGPLGFSYFPTAITPGTFLLGEALGGLIQIAVVTVLLANVRRTMGLPAAIALTLIAASILGFTEAEPLTVIAFGLVALALTAPAPRAQRAFRMLAIGGGVLAGYALLVKLNDGVAAGAIVTVGLLGGEDRRRNLVRAGASLLSTLLVLWLLVGEPLGALPDYLRNSYQVVAGYVEAMGHNEIGSHSWHMWLVLGSALALSVGAWRALDTSRLRRRAALVGAVLLVHYFLAREIFVRYDPGHLIFLALLVPVALMIPWRRAQRATGVALACMFALTSLLASQLSVGAVVNPLGDAHRLVDQARDVLHPGALIAEGRKDVRGADGIPRSIVLALRGHCVTAEPDEIAAVWAHPKWRWCPLPVFQSYAAYTPRLDRLNAAAYADARHGPDRVLRQVDQAIDGQNPIWESPAAALSMLCHFTEIEHSGEWQALARVPDRCGKPYTLAVIHSSLRRTIALPSVPEDAVMVAAIDGIQVAGWERLETLLLRAQPRYVEVNGKSELTFRVAPGTADDGLILWVPQYADYAAPFNLNMDPHTLRVTVDGHSSGAITVRLYAVPIAPPAAAPAAVAAGGPHPLANRP
jgi:hypothetical protein